MVVLVIGGIAGFSYEFFSEEQQLTGGAIWGMAITIIILGAVGGFVKLSLVRKSKRFLTIIDDTMVLVPYAASVKRYVPNSYERVTGEDSVEYCFYIQRGNVQGARVVTSPDEMMRLKRANPMAMAEYLQTTLVTDIDRTVCLEFREPLRFIERSRIMAAIEKRVAHPDITKLYLSVEEPMKVVQYFTKR